MSLAGVCLKGRIGAAVQNLRDSPAAAVQRHAASLAFLRPSFGGIRNWPRP
jgi:hypothetical protein